MIQTQVLRTLCRETKSTTTKQRLKHLAHLAHDAPRPTQMIVDSFIVWAMMRLISTPIPQFTIFTFMKLRRHRFFEYLSTLRGVTTNNLGNVVCAHMLVYYAHDRFVNKQCHIADLYAYVYALRALKDEQYDYLNLVLNIAYCGLIDQHVNNLQHFAANSLASPHVTLFYLDTLYLAAQFDVALVDHVLHGHSDILFDLSSYRADMIPLIFLEPAADEKQVDVYYLSHADAVRFMQPPALDTENKLNKQMTVTVVDFFRDTYQAICLR